MPICVDLLIGYLYILYSHNVCLFTDSRDVKQALNNFVFFHSHGFGNRKHTAVYCRYYHLTEGVRPDLVLFDQEVGVIF